MNYYAIYDRYSDELLAEGNARECMKALGCASLDSFYALANRSRRGINKKYRYEEYAARYNRHLQNGELGACGEDLYLMAAVLRQEGARKDELKALMLSFYFDLSGTGSGPAVNRNTSRRAGEAVAAANIGVHEMEELYLDTVRMDTVPAPIMSVRDSLFIFELCLGGRHDEAEEILRKFAEDARK